MTIVIREQFTVLRPFLSAGFLGDKTRVLVTHQVQHLADDDRVVLMDNVRIRTVSGCNVNPGDG